ncbi:hypothetical protein D3C83_20080 [compost metagenome]
MEAVGVAVGERCRRHHQVRVAELLAGLEGLVEDGAGDQVAHLQADQCLPAARRRFRHLDVQAMVGRILEFEVRLPLDLNGFD